MVSLLHRYYSTSIYRLFVLQGTKFLCSFANPCDIFRVGCFLTKNIILDTISHAIGLGTLRLLKRQFQGRYTQAGRRTGWKIWPTWLAVSDRTDWLTIGGPLSRCRETILSQSLLSPSLSSFSLSFFFPYFYDSFQRYWSYIYRQNRSNLGEGKKKKKKRS